MALLAPFQLLEVNLISAQDLEPVCRKMRTYAVAWVHPERKLTTRVDTMGHTNPNWNDKFVFRVNDLFLYGDTSAVMIEIYALHWFRDIHVGTVRVIVGNLIPPSERPHNDHYMQVGMRFVALQIRRPSGRPQGILNIGVALLDSSKRSMPLYMNMGSSALGYKHLMGEEDIPTNNNSTANHQPRIVKPDLRRTKSDSSSIIGMEAMVRKRRSSVVNGSMLNGSMINGGSMVNGAEARTRGSSMVNGGFTVNGSDVGKAKGKEGKAGSIVNGSEIGGPDKKNESWATQLEVKGPLKRPGSLIDGLEDSGDSKKPLKNGVHDNNASKSPPKNASGLDFGSQNKFPKYTGFEYGVIRRPGAFWTDSELGPSPSEVAANVAKNMHHRMDDAESSILGWSLDGSIEGLDSKLERWRSELPTLYDHGEYSSYRSSYLSSPKKAAHNQRYTEGGSLFSCFGSMCGCQCSIVIGGSPPSSPDQKGGKLRRTPSSFSFDTLSFL